jgi:hypothetical protein
LISRKGFSARAIRQKKASIPIKLLFAVVTARNERKCTSNILADMGGQRTLTIAMG